MTYFKRGSAHCEFMRWTFSVIFSIVRSLRTGTEEGSGPPVDVIVLEVRVGGAVETVGQLGEEWG